MGHTQSTVRGTMIGCHLCNKSIREISLLLYILRSTASGIITKWKQLGATAPSGRPCKMTEQGQCMLRRTVRRSHQLFSESIAKDLQTSCGLQFSITEYKELHGIRQERYRTCASYHL
ncbi:unnamed protein product, partial [Staurois parvus]